MAEAATPAVAAPEVPAEVAPPSAQAPVEATPTAPVPADGEPSAKRARAEDGSAVVPPQEQPGADVPKNPVQSLEELAVQFLPMERQKELYDILSTFTSELVDTRKMNAQQQAELAEKSKELDSLRKSHEEQEDKEQKTARKLAGIMNKLFEAYGTDVVSRSEGELDQIATAIREAPQVLDFLQPVAVAASNINSRMKRAREEHQVSFECSRIQKNLISLVLTFFSTFPFILKLVSI